MVLLVVVLLGSPGSGKTTLLETICDKSIKQANSPTKCNTSMYHISCGALYNQGCDPSEILTLTESIIVEQTTSDIVLIDGPKNYNDLVAMQTICGKHKLKLMVFELLLIPQAVYRRITKRNRTNEDVRKRMIRYQKDIFDIYNSTLGLDKKIIKLDARQSIHDLVTTMTHYLTLQNPNLFMPVLTDSFHDIIATLLQQPQGNLNIGFEEPSYIITNEHQYKSIVLKDQYDEIIMPLYSIVVWLVYYNNEVYVVSPFCDPTGSFRCLFTGNHFYKDINLKRCVKYLQGSIIEALLVPPKDHPKQCHSLEYFRHIDDQGVVLTDVLVMKEKVITHYPSFKRQEILRDQLCEFFCRDSRFLQDYHVYRVLYKPHTSAYYMKNNPLKFMLILSNKLSTIHYWDPADKMYKVTKNTCDYTHWLLSQNREEYVIQPKTYNREWVWEKKEWALDHCPIYQRPEILSVKYTIVQSIILDAVTIGEFTDTERERRKSIIKFQTITNPVAKLSYQQLSFQLEQLQLSGDVTSMVDATSNLTHYNRANASSHEIAMNVCGLTMDVTNKKILNYPMTRFREDTPLCRLVSMTPKLDGSLIIAVKGPNLTVKTKKRETSAQAIYAKKFIETHTNHALMKEHYTYNFEACFQNNKLVVEHHMDTLVLLSIFDDAGSELHYNECMLFAMEFGVPMVAKVLLDTCDLTHPSWHSMVTYRYKIPLEGFVLMGFTTEGVLMRKKIVFTNYKIAKRHVMQIHPSFLQPYQHANALAQFLMLLPIHYIPVAHAVLSARDVSSSRAVLSNTFDPNMYPFFKESYYKNWPNVTQKWGTYRTPPTIDKLSFDCWKKIIEILEKSAIVNIMATCKSCYLMCLHIKPLFPKLSVNTTFNLHEIMYGIKYIEHNYETNQGDYIINLHYDSE